MLQRNGARQRLLFVLFTMAAVGCATMGSTKPIPLAANDMAWLRDQSEIVLIHHQTPQLFRIWKTDYLAPFWEGLGYPFALIAVERRREEAIREGEQIRTRYSVADPVLGAKARFEYELRSSWGSRVFVPSVSPSPPTTHISLLIPSVRSWRSIS